MSIDQMRRSYTHAGLDVADVATDPIEQFRIWFDQARAADPPDWLEVNAMTLSTADPGGRVSSRIVLLKSIEPTGFVFFTNYRSDKGQQIDTNGRVALCFFWPHLERQVRIEGVAARTTRDLSLKYFHSRPRGSQLGAVVSDQSAVIADRDVLQRAYERLDAAYADSPIPLPEHWGGYAVQPERIEFWQGRPSRLHDRILYQRDDSGSHWTICRLSP